jgi:hypothetical protein
MPHHLASQSTLSNQILWNSQRSSKGTRKCAVVAAFLHHLLQPYAYVVAAFLHHLLQPQALLW